MNLFIGNLSPDVTEAQLNSLFSEFGIVLSVKIPVDKETGLPRGFGFVEMEDKFHAYDAIDNLDATYLSGTIISVKESKPKTQGGSGGGFNRGGGNRGGGGFNRDRNDRGGSRPGGFNRGNNDYRNRNYNSGGSSNYNGDNFNSIHNTNDGNS